jgi:peptide chain release factor 2
MEVSLTAIKSSGKSRPWRRRWARPTSGITTRSAQKHIAKLNGLKRRAPVVAFQKKIDDVAVMIELIEASTPPSRKLTPRNSRAPRWRSPWSRSSTAGDCLVPHRAVRPQQRHLFDPGRRRRHGVQRLGRHPLPHVFALGERRGFTVELMDVQPGDTAGISKATILIKGENAYGYAKAERGVHRLVRISPFDSNKRRHTSFCAVDVVAEITDEIDVEIPEEDDPRRRLPLLRQGRPGRQHHRLRRAPHAHPDRASSSSAKTSARRSRTRPPP